MKKIAFILVALVAMFSSCNTYKTYSNGKEDVATIMVVQKKSEYKQVEIIIDGESHIANKINRDRDINIDSQYQVTPGKHNVIIKHEGKVIIEKQVLIGVQETCKIMLP